MSTIEEITAGAINSEILDDSDLKTVLIIDDDITNCELLAEFFSTENYRLLFALDGIEGVHVLTERKKADQFVDVIILDKVMPNMDGMEFLKQPILKRYPLTPIIMLSGDLSQQETVEAYRTGIWDFIAKPSDMNGLLERVRIQLNKVEFLKKEAFKQEELERLVHIDQVTNLPNVKSFFTNYKTINRDITLLILNLDKFSDVNNIFGRPVGDDVLRSVKSRLVSHLGENTYIARLGGAEFVVILEKTFKEDTIRFTSALREAISDSYKIRDLNIHIAVSIGIAFYPEHGKEITILLKNANIAASQANLKGRHISVFDDDMLIKIRHENEIKNDLRYALEKDPEQFKVYYQPVVDRNKKTVGAEALIRWHHPVNGLIPPFQFIPIAEKSDELMVPLTKLIMETVCQKIAEWNKDSFYVSVNISTLDLLSNNFINTLETLIKKYGLKREQLKIEITESHIMDDPE
ncbi:MAG: EAL domain-containing protein, partial [SAR324 cluster bacterium]|nr:EAL domain-containing protein [SAR324 cluster bacterium]